MLKCLHEHIKSFSRKSCASEAVGLKHFDGSDVLLDHCLEDVGMLVQSIFELELNLSDNMKALLELRQHSAANSEVRV